MVISGLVLFVCATQLVETVSQSGSIIGAVAAEAPSEPGTVAELLAIGNFIRGIALLTMAGGIILVILTWNGAKGEHQRQLQIDEAYHFLQNVAVPVVSQPRATGVGLEQLIEGIHRVSLDIAESRKKEKAVVDRAVDVVCILGLDGRFVFVSQACRNAWGWTPEELHGKALTSILIGDQSQEKLHSIIGAANSIQQVVFECQLQRPDGALVDLEWTGHWSASDAGFFCIVHDISEKKRLERLRGEFLAMVAHDLRSPLSGMQGVLALMEAGVLGQLTEEGRQITSKVRHTCKRLVRLLNDMLDLDKAGAGKFELERCNFPLNAAIEQAIIDVRDQADAKRVSIGTPNEQVVVYGDEDRLTQVIANLLGNAVKFAPEGSVVMISAQSEAGQMRISVTDQGRGIPQEKLDVIFEKFEQVNTIDVRESRGVGLGLAICKTIVEEHGGAIGVESRTGGGSTFWFTVPQALPAQALEISAGSMS